MSIDFTHDYSDHVLLDSRNRYKELYKLAVAEAADVKKGDLVLLKGPCGCYKIFMATADSDEDGTLHLTKYAELDFVSANNNDESNGDGIVISDYDPCSC